MAAVGRNILYYRITIKEIHNFLPPMMLQMYHNASLFGKFTFKAETAFSAILIPLLIICLTI